MQPADREFIRVCARLPAAERTAIAGALEKLRIGMLEDMAAAETSSVEAHRGAARFLKLLVHYVGQAVPLVQHMDSDR